MTGTPLETLPRRTAFERSCVTRSMRLPTTRSHGRVMGDVPDGTSSRAFRSPSCIGYAVMKSRSSPSLTVDVGRDTGGPDSDRPSNFRMQRPALRAAADPARYPEVVRRKG